MANIEGVWDVIAAACAKVLSPSQPSPASGGGGDEPRP
jgi:hypothetical protein